jgi:hypothetical protein
LVAEPTAGQSQTAWNRQTGAGLYAVYSVRVGQEGSLRKAIVQDFIRFGFSERQRGYAVDGEEIEEGRKCIGAPVRDYSGKVIASMNIAGPASRLLEEKIPPLAAAVMRAAGELSAELGYRPMPDGARRRPFSSTTPPQEAKGGTT